jgi:hypothetical protein
VGYGQYFRSPLLHRSEQEPQGIPTLGGELVSADRQISRGVEFYSDRLTGCKHSRTLHCLGKVMTPYTASPAADDDLLDLPWHTSAIEDPDKKHLVV